ncbi:hydroxymethylpyrimidine pyrophosphatase-like HAD family hydrolase [Rhizobium sp. BK060]|nr:hydroxymethylpyrimidine pyrophosphatase-like HAD family hydrolase [Rhizobium sp. BK060]
MRAFLSESCEVSRSNERLLEIAPKGVSKGDGARRLAAHLKLDRQHCVAAGDAENGLSLLRWASTAVTVGNAITSIKEISEYIGAPADDGGMAGVVRWLLDRTDPISASNQAVLKP